MNPKSKQGDLQKTLSRQISSAEETMVAANHATHRRQLISSKGEVSLWAKRGLFSLLSISDCSRRY